MRAASTSELSPSRQRFRELPVRSPKARFDARQSDVDAARMPRYPPANPKQVRDTARAGREVYGTRQKLPGIEVTGTDVHIGSQINRSQPHGDSVSDLVRIRADLRADATRSPCRFRRRPGHSLLHGREAPPAPDAYAAMVKPWCTISAAR